MLHTTLSCERGLCSSHARHPLSTRLLLPARVALASVAQLQSHALLPAGPATCRESGCWLSGHVRAREKQASVPGHAKSRRGPEMAEKACRNFPAGAVADCCALDTCGQHHLSASALPSTPQQTLPQSARAIGWSTWASRSLPPRPPITEKVSYIAILRISKSRRRRRLDDECRPQPLGNLHGTRSQRAIKQWPMKPPKCSRMRIAFSCCTSRG